MIDISVTPNDILHIIAGRARDISLYASNPNQNFSPEELRKAVTGLFAYADQLVNVVNEMRANQPPADQAN
jgi:hypothetical protein